MKKRSRHTTISKFRAFYELTKPGIIYGNILMLVGGFLFGAQGSIQFLQLLAATVGTALVIACGCVINNYLDQDIDAHMRRTKKRQLVTRQISDNSALIYAAILGALGFAVLAQGTNSTTLYMGALGLVMYGIVYTFAKRRTVHATLIGTVPGALPPVAGYTAATGQLDWSALMLFLIMVFWQMVHFYAIAIFRKQEYKSANVPVLPLVHGVRATKIQMSLYGLAFSLAIFGFWRVSDASIVFMVIMLGLSSWWVALILKGFGATSSNAWAQVVFSRSLLLLPSLSLLLATSVWFT